MNRDAMPATRTSNAPDTPCEEQRRTADVTMEDLFFYDVGQPNKKRKSPGPDSATSEAFDTTSQTVTQDSQPAKKARLVDADNEVSRASSGLVKDKSLLPPEVWHHIFTFCSPRTLVSLLQVNKLFSHYINPSSSVRAEYPRSAQRGVLSLVKPNSILVASRRLFWPHVPAPLRSMGELDMWRLLCSKQCQECNKSDVRVQLLPMSHMHAGPGKEGVSVVWPLGIRVCGQCLLLKTVKVRALYLRSLLSLPLVVLAYCLA